MVVAGVFIRIPSLYTESIINTISELVFPPISDATPQPSTSADAEKVDQDFIEDVSHAPSADCIVDVEVFEETVDSDGFVEDDEPVAKKKKTAAKNSAQTRVKWSHAEEEEIQKLFKSNFEKKTVQLPVRLKNV